MTTDTHPAEAPTAEVESTLRVPQWRRLLRRVTRNHLAFAGLVILAVLIGVVMIGPFVYTTSPFDADLANRFAPPGEGHPLGTDQIGRDVLARLIHGGRLTLFVAVAATAVALAVGALYGLVAGYVGGAVDSALMRVADIIIAFPPLLLALAIAAIRGPSVGNLVLAISIPSVPRLARLMRSTVLSVRERDYVAAARAGGTRPSRILWLHVMPNASGPVVVAALVWAGAAVLQVAALGYLGIGVQPPTPEWGTMLRDAQTYIRESPALLFGSGLAITLAIIGFNLVGDTARDLIAVEER